jgi:hypothetical protein
MRGYGKILAISAITAFALVMATGCGGMETIPEEPTVVTAPAPPPSGFLPAPDEETHSGEQGLPDVDSDGVSPETKAERVVYINKGGTIAIQGDSVLDETMSKDFTLEFWLNIATGNNKTVMSTRGFHVLTRENQLIVHFNGVYINGPTLKKNEWYHIALAVYTDGLKVYVNGSRVADGRLREHLERPVGAIVFGGDRRAPLVGYIDNVRLIKGIHYKTNFLVNYTFKPADAEFAYDFNTSTTEPIDLTGNGRIVRIAGDVQIVTGKL